MSDTPRTDAVEAQFYPAFLNAGGKYQELEAAQKCWIEHEKNSRTLERELAEVKAERDTLRKVCNQNAGIASREIEEVAVLRAKLEEMTAEKDAAGHAAVVAECKMVDTLAKLAKCREALSKVLPIAVGTFLTSSEAANIANARKTLEETK